MNKRICDICEKNEANNNYKIKQEKCFGYSDMGHIFPRYEWVEVDICDECFEKMKTIKDYRKLFDRIADQAIKGWGTLYDGDIDKQSEYLAGVEAACNAIDPKYQFKI